MLQSNEHQIIIVYSQETSGYSTEINEGVLTNYSGGIGKPTNCSCKPVGSGRIQTTTTTFDQSKNQEQRSTPLHLNKTQMSPCLLQIFRLLFQKSSVSIQQASEEEGQIQRYSLKGRGGWTGPVMSDLPCPSSGEQERTCNCPWSRLAHAAQGYWRTVNSARDIFCVFPSILLYKTNKRYGQSRQEQAKVHVGGQAHEEV